MINPAPAPPEPTAEQDRNFAQLGADYRLVIHQTGEDLRLHWFSPSVSRTFGAHNFYSESAANLARFVHPEDFPQVLQWWQALPEQGEHTAIEIRLLDADGGIRWLRLRIKVQPNQPNDRLLYVAGQDTTASKHSELSLIRHTEEVTSLVQIGQAVVAQLDLDVLLNHLVGVAQTLVGADRAAILLATPNGALRLAAPNPDRHLNGGNVATEVLATGQPTLLSTESADTSFTPRQMSLPMPSARSLLAVPLRLGDRVLGVLEALHTDPNGFAPNDLYLLEAVANWAVIAISNAQQFRAARRRHEESEALAEISRELLNRATDLDSIFARIVETAVQIIANADRAVIHLLNPQRDQLHAAAVSGRITRAGQPASSSSLRPGEGVAGRVALLGITVNVPDITTDPRYKPLGRETDVRSLLAAPVEQAGERYGVISVSSEMANAFTDDDERMLKAFGVHVALAIGNARLIENIQQSLEKEQATRARLVQTEKLASMGRLVASVAHELNNPLQAIQNSVYLARSDSSISKQAQGDLDLALEEISRMAGLIARLRDTYRPTLREEFRPIDLHELIGEVERLIAIHLRHRKVNYHYHPAPKLPPITCIRDQIKQVLINMCLNAVEALGEGGNLTVETLHLPNQSAVQISFADDGPGIPTEYLDNIFDPFFTTKEGGTGLGLAITYDIVRRHNGRIELTTEEGLGTLFTITLPLTPTTPLSGEPPLNLMAHKG